jgi:cell division protease FtsH
MIVWLFISFVSYGVTYKLNLPSYRINTQLKHNNNYYNNFNNNNKYQLSNPKFVERMKLLNNQNNQNNQTITDNENIAEQLKKHIDNELTKQLLTRNPTYLNIFGLQIQADDLTTPKEDDDNTSTNDENKKSKNFEIVTKPGIYFKDIGGYNSVKTELHQCVDLLKNYKKYKEFNVRVPKGLILEGPPGTGKTLLAKALASESNCNFISVAGSDFQEKYVGVGPARVKELFELAKKNIPCIIFIDEIDAVGRKRVSEGESSSAERDNTLNALLVELDGFKNNSGIFLVAATNRLDLLDNALIRPGRIDKKIYIGLPDKLTRESIINIHIKGKPHDKTVLLDNTVELTEGLTGAQIENLLNEAMLNALKMNKTVFTNMDLDLIMNKMLAGWQPNDHEYNSDTIDRIAIHEMGHAITGYFALFHSNITKVVINLSSPKSPGYTVFQNTLSTLYTRESLFERLMVLLSGRIAEEIFYNVSVTTGAINDLKEALDLAEKMIVYYGMGTSLIYPSKSEKYKEIIDEEIITLINKAYKYAEMLLLKHKEFVYEGAILLKKEKKLTLDDLDNLYKLYNIKNSASFI